MQQTQQWSNAHTHDITQTHGFYMHGPREGEGERQGPTCTVSARKKKSDREASSACTPAQLGRRFPLPLPVCSEVVAAVDHKLAPEVSAVDKLENKSTPPCMHIKRDPRGHAGKKTRDVRLGYLCVCICVYAAMLATRSSQARKGAMTQAHG